ncbi:hypothetical protein TRVL_03785 [Trypanosoma vivax]|nr:hypothetical protein TRVL_03785 [Trypanosoma vivax]
MARARRSSPSQSHAAPPPARHTPTHTHTQHQAPASHPQPQVTNVYMQRPGAGSGILGTVASVAAGSVLGHGISHMLFDRNAPPAQAAEAQEVARQVGGGACAPQIQVYSKCLEANESRPEVCKWAWDTFTQCQAEHQPSQ